MSTELSLTPELNELVAGAKPRRRSMKSKSRSRRSTSPRRSRSRCKSYQRRSRKTGHCKNVMKGGEVSNDANVEGGVRGYDAFGDRNLGSLPKKKNFAFTGANVDDEALIESKQSDPQYSAAKKSYDSLYTLYKQMRRVNVSQDKAMAVLKQIEQFDEAEKASGVLPQWVKDYVSSAEEKVKAAEVDLMNGNRDAADSDVYEALLEHKKLAYMIMEALTGVAVGSGASALEWREQRRYNLADKLSWEQGPSSVSSGLTRSPKMFEALVPKSSTDLTRMSPFDIFGKPIGGPANDMSNIFGSPIGGGKKRRRHY